MACALKPATRRADNQGQMVEGILVDFLKNVLLLASLGVLLTACGAGPRSAPDVVGEKLDAAEKTIEAAGYKADVSGGGVFGVVDKSAWTVCEQGVEGKTVNVAVARTCTGTQAAPPQPAAPATPSQPTPTQPATLQDELRRQHIEVKEVDTEGDTIVVIFKVGDNITANLRRIGAQKDVLTIMEAAHHFHPGKHLTVRGDFPLVDKYGNESEGMVLLLNYSPATLARVNYENPVVRENVFDLADASPKMVHPDLQGKS